MKKINQSSARKMREFLFDLANDPFRLESQDEREKLVFEASELVLEADGKRVKP